MTHFAINPSSVRAGNLGPATGDIWLQIEDMSFPKKGWNDFVVVVLTAWATALLRLLDDNSTRECVYFMEGPYSVELSAHQGAVTLRALEKDRIEHAATETDAATLLQSLVDGADAVLGACRDIGWESTDTDRLAAVLPELRQLIGGQE